MIRTLIEAVDEFHTTHADAQLAGKQGFLAGAEWMRNQFKLWGTDACIDCDTGRATIYATLEGRCVRCEHQREKAAEKEK